MPQPSGLPSAEALREQSRDALLRCGVDTDRLTGAQAAQSPILGTDLLSLRRTVDS